MGGVSSLEYMVCMVQSIQLPESSFSFGQTFKLTQPGQLF